MLGDLSVDVTRPQLLGGTCSLATEWTLVGAEAGSSASKPAGLQAGDACPFQHARTSWQRITLQLLHLDAAFFTSDKPLPHCPASLQPAAQPSLPMYRCFQDTVQSMSRTFFKM